MRFPPVIGKKKPATRRAVGLLVVVNIKGEREYSYKVPGFAHWTGQKKTRRPGGLAGVSKWRARDGSVGVFQGDY
jgi:hypothetical protein